MVTTLAGTKNRLETFKNSAFGENINHLPEIAIGPPEVVFSPITMINCSISGHREWAQSAKIRISNRIHSITTTQFS